MTDAAAHEQRDDAFCARGEVRSLRGIRIEADGLRVARRIVRRGGQKAVLIEQMRQSQTAQAAAGFKQEIASGPESFHGQAPSLPAIIRQSAYFLTNDG